VIVPFFFFDGLWIVELAGVERFFVLTGDAAVAVPPPLLLLGSVFLMTGAKKFVTLLGFGTA